MSLRPTSPPVALGTMFRPLLLKNGAPGRSLVKANDWGACTCWKGRKPTGVVVVGIMNSTYEGDRMREMFAEQNKPLSDKLTQYDKLLTSAKSHSAYRMALASFEQAAIPETYVF